MPKYREGEMLGKQEKVSSLYIFAKEENILTLHAHFSRNQPATKTNYSIM